MVIRTGGAVLAAAAVLALTACQQERNTTSTTAPVRDVPPAAVAAGSTAKPANVPPGDPSLPPAEAANTKTGNVDGAYTALTPAERDKAQPLEGQVNNYSSDAFSKRGNDNVPRENPNGPRGSEAVATPNSYPKETK